MKRIDNFKRLFFTILSLLITANLWGQTLSTEPGNQNTPGSEDNPYLIASAADWNNFVTDVNDGYSYSGKFVKLTANIGTAESPITNMAGTWSSKTNYKAFSGTFDGGWHTIIFNKGTLANSFNEDRCAPFRIIDKATIKNLIVEGKIVTGKKFAGGLVGWVYSNPGTSYISNCISRIDITSTLNNNGDATHGGFVGQQEAGTINFEECIFEGNISQKTGNTAKKAAGFMGWRGGTVKYTKCIQAGKINMNSNTATYHRGTNGGGTFVNACYIFAPEHLESYGSQGALVTSSATVPTDGIYWKYTENTDNYYVAGGVITGLENTIYSYGSPSVAITPVVKYYGKILTRGTDYIIKVDDTEVPTETTPTLSTTENHTVVIEGKNGYAGSQTFEFTVVNGTGTADDPYQIRSNADWDDFAASVNGGQSFNGEFFKLCENITVSEMVGTDTDPFKGTFIGKDGQTIYTITFNKGTNETPFDEEYCAPFRYIDGATIKDLNVAGAIYSSKDRAAGLIGKSSGTSTVQDVTVSANIIATGKSYCSGFASANSGTLNLTRCIYNGKIVADDNCAGFCASESGTTNINICMFEPAAETSVSGGQNLSRSSENNITEGYYTYKIGESTQGYGAYTAQPAKVLSKKMTLMDGVDYYVDGKAEIKGVEDFYNYTGNAITVTNTVKFFGETIDAANYTVSITLNNVVSTVVNKGEYKLTVSGVNDNNYYGSISTEFTVVTGPLSGSGTDASPYLITSAADWNDVVDRVSYGLDADKYYRLTADIEVSTMIGQSSSNKMFNGVFDGNWHKITFTKGTAESPFNEDYCAPFRYVQDATIMNLTVDGTIVSSKKYVGGLVGYFYANEKGNIVNCTSSVNINCSHITGDCYYGGFVGEIRSSSSGYLRFRNCMFDGSIVDGRETKAAENCSGFVGHVIVDAVDYTRDMIYVNCCMNGTISVKGKTANFHRGSDVPTLFHRTYYLINNTSDEADQGAAAPTTVTDNYISKKYTVSATDYYVPAVVVLGLETEAKETAPSMALYGSKLTKGTDFSVTGSNPYTISGDHGNNFYGSVTTRIVDNWTVLNAALKNDGIVDLVADVAAGPSDGSLLVSGGVNVTLNMNGHTIDRHLSSETNLGHVFRILSDNTLTINGNGTITGGYNKATGDEFDGGGIYNMGNLTLNSVYLSGNRCLKKDGEDASARGGGVYSGTGSSLIMNGCYVTSNKAQGGGGGVYGLEALVFILDDDYFFQNESESKGGGVRVKTKDNVVAKITNSNFVWNMVTAPAIAQAAQGGGIYMEGGKLDMENNTIIGNVSNLQGCGMFHNNGTTTAKNCKIIDNGTYQDNINSSGGGVYIQAGTFIMEGGEIIENFAMGGTGGIHVNKGAKLQLKGKVTIWNNRLVTGLNPVYKNVYLDDYSSDGVIEILEGFNGESQIGVFKNFTTGFAGVFTKNLYAHGGTAANFTTDDAAFSIGPNAEEPTEAKFTSPKAWTEVVSDPEYITKTGDAEPYSYEIKKPVNVITGNVTANTISFSGEGCLYIESGATLTAEIINNYDPVRLVVEDGGQVITTSENVKATVKKNTTPGKWFLISSAIINPEIATETNVITTDIPTQSPSTTYDLYRFNEATSLQWENFRAGHADFTRFTDGRGYLYRNSVYGSYTVIMEGTLNVGTLAGDTDVRIVEYLLTCAGTNEFRGFNIIGNPYSHNITKGNANANILNEDLLEEKYYVLEEREVGDAKTKVLDWYLNEDGTEIPPTTGILVQAKQLGYVTITNILPAAEPASKSGEKEIEKRNLWFTVANNSYMDEACVEFREGHGLNKIERMNEDAPMLYIRHNDENFASVEMNPDTKAFNLNFEAATMGRYTLSVKPQGDFSYLHLIDKVEGSDIDLLAEGEYSFIGSPSDSKDRFVVRLGAAGGDDDNQSFAYQSGDDIVVSGEGELRVFDIMGRLVMTQHIDGVEMIRKPSQTGVYILRLNEVSQKIVVK